MLWAGSEAAAGDAKAFISESATLSNAGGTPVPLAMIN
jgi:hypothetical protein